PIGVEATAELGETWLYPTVIGEDVGTGTPVTGRGSFRSTAVMVQYLADVEVMGVTVPQGVLSTTQSIECILEIRLVVPPSPEIGEKISTAVLALLAFKIYEAGGGPDVSSQFAITQLELTPTELIDDRPNVVSDNRTQDYIMRLTVGAAATSGLRDVLGHVVWNNANDRRSPLEEFVITAAPLPVPQVTIQQVANVEPTQFVDPVSTIGYFIPGNYPIVRRGQVESGLKCKLKDWGEAKAAIPTIRFTYKRIAGGVDDTDSVDVVNSFGPSYLDGGQEDFFENQFRCTAATLSGEHEID
ncbi:unnamed protein product, partial [marine sediment metagenome]